MSSTEELLDRLPIVHQFGCPTLEIEDGGLMDYSCRCGNTSKAKKILDEYVANQINAVLDSIESRNLGGIFIDPRKSSAELVAEHRISVQARIESERQKLKGLVSKENRSE